MTIVKTQVTPDSYHPTEVALPPETTIPDSLLLQVTTRIGEVKGDENFTKCPLVSTEGQPQFTPEGDELPEASPDVAEIIIASGKVGYYEKVTREQLLSPEASKILAADMQRSLANRANYLLLNQPAPVSPALLPPAGILTQGVVNAAVDGSLDEVSMAIAQIESLPDGQATHILIDPIGWATLNIMRKATGSNESLLGSGADVTERRLKGVPVIVTSQMPSHTLAIVDKRRLLSAYGSVLASTSEHAFFTSDVVTAKLTIRFGVVVNNDGATSASQNAVQVLPIAPREEDEGDLGEGEGE